MKNGFTKIVLNLCNKIKQLRHAIVMIIPILMNFFLCAFCHLKTTKFIINVIVPYLSPKRNPMVLIIFAE